MNGLRAAQPQKDTESAADAARSGRAGALRQFRVSLLLQANTGLLPLGKGGRVLALMEQCLPAELRVETDGTVTTVAAGFDFDGQLEG